MAFDIYLWIYPKTDNLIKIDNVPETEVNKYTTKWLNKNPNNDCMIASIEENYYPTGANVTIATDEWLNTHLLA